MVDMLAVAGSTFQRVIMVDEYCHLRDVQFEDISFQPLSERCIRHYHIESMKAGHAIIQERS